MPTPKKPLDAARFGRLSVLGSAVGGWRCACDCGREVVVTGSRLRAGDTRSCGCLHSDQRRAPKKHGKSKAPVRKVWEGMVRRCTDSRDASWPNYGARGIKVCSRWLTFENFLADMGEPQGGMTLERTRNEGDYEPGNCCWATRTQQARNRRSNRVLTIGGASKSLADWVDGAGLPYSRVISRLNRGWSPERALEMESRA